MRSLIAILIALNFCPLAAAQEPYRCKINGSMVIQDRPCPGASRYSDDMPKPRPAMAEALPSRENQENDRIEAIRRKTEADKAYIDGRVKERNYQLDKQHAQDELSSCEAKADEISRRISEVSASSGRGWYARDRTELAAMQLEEQKKQNYITGLQADESAQRRRCDTMREDFRKKFPR